MSLCWLPACFKAPCSQTACDAWGNCIYMPYQCQWDKISARDRNAAWRRIATWRSFKTILKLEAGGLTKWLKSQKELYIGSSKTKKQTLVSWLRWFCLVLYGLIRDPWMSEELYKIVLSNLQGMSSPAHARSRLLYTISEQTKWIGQNLPMSYSSKRRCLDKIDYIWEWTRHLIDHSLKF